MARFGSLGTQYFDDSGEVLTGGYIQFYASGTTTPIDTYADVNLTIQNEWPVELDSAGRQPNIFFDGIAKATLRNSAGAMIATADPVGQSGTTFGSVWTSAERYEPGDVVLADDGNYYEAITTNQNEYPPSNPDDWFRIQFLGTWNSLITYIAEDIVELGGLLYTSQQASNLNHNPSTDDGTWWISLSTPKLKRVPRTSNTILTKANRGQWIDVTSGTFTQTFDSAADLGADWFAYYSNNGTGDVTIPSSDGVTNWIMYPGEMRIFQCDGTDIRSFVITAFYKSFTSSGSFVKPPGYKQFSGRLWGAGGGGNNTGTATGAGGGACVPFTILAALLAATTTYTQAAGGAPNSAGGNSTFGSHVTAYGGGPAGNGTPGSGGGMFSAGSTTTSPGQPARNIGTSEANEGFGGGAGASSGVAGGVSPYGGGGGGYNNSAGGNSLYGGGGGGQTGGNSAFGGDGGSTGQNGQQPGGGGGPGATTGGPGQLDIWGEA